MKVNPKCCILNKNFSFKIASKNGFTLLELMIVVIITGILAAISIPAVMSQIGKARETEAKMNISSIGMAQQEYFFEKATFADRISNLSVSVNNGYYSYPDPNLISETVVKHQAIPFDALNKNIRHYSMGVYFNSDRSYSVKLCQSSNPSLEAEVADTPTAGCTSGTPLE
jgi:type IV pilus assembly protein PilA